MNDQTTPNPIDVISKALQELANSRSSDLVVENLRVLEFKGKKYKVPKVLLSGNHKDIEEWKKLTKGEK